MLLYERLRIHLHVLALTFVCVSWAQPLPVLAQTSEPQKLFQPGAIDFQQRLNDGGRASNLRLWTPFIKGGYGRIEADQGGRSEYFGGYIRPLHTRQNAGDLIIGVQQTIYSGVTDREGLVEYRLPKDKLVKGVFGVGLGLVDQESIGTETRFFKVSYRGQVSDDVRIVGSAHVQNTANTTFPGGYLALYDTTKMVAGGSDGEQWRLAFGYIHPGGSKLRPAVEIFRVDQSVGKRDGPTFLLATASLKYSGFGFLSHESRLGRALGPQGLQFTNPIGFVQPTWNRAMEIAEIGGMIAARVQETRLSSGQRFRNSQVLVFPFQFDANVNKFDWLFSGAGLRESSSRKNAPYLIAGASGVIQRVGFTVESQWDLEDDTLRALLTAQYFL